MPAVAFTQTTEAMEQGHRVSRALGAASCGNFENLGDLLEQQGQLLLVISTVRGGAGLWRNKELKGSRAGPLLASR